MLLSDYFFKKLNIKLIYYILLVYLLNLIKSATKNTLINLIIALCRISKIKSSIELTIIKICFLFWQLYSFYWIIIISTTFSIIIIFIFNIFLIIIFNNGKHLRSRFSWFLTQLLKILLIIRIIYITIIYFTVTINLLWKITFKFDALCIINRFRFIYFFMSIYFIILFFLFNFIIQIIKLFEKFKFNRWSLIFIFVVYCSF